MTLEYTAKVLNMVRTSLDQPREEQPMSATYTGLTRWDAEIAEAGAERQRATSKVYRDLMMDKIARLGAKVEGYRRGYADAKTEDAALLEALRMAWGFVQTSGAAETTTGRAFKAAIAQATKGE